MIVSTSTIESSVVDIRSDVPRADDVFLIDTNIWYWYSYPRAIAAAQPPLNYQTRIYPAYIKKAKKTKSVLYWCGLSLSELAHIIERNEREIYNRTGSNVGTKAFRRLESERKLVVSHIDSAWSVVKATATSLPEISITEDVTEHALELLKGHNLDGYDLFMIESSLQSRVSKIITDDSDYTSVPGITVFTANERIILEAQSQGKLVTRG